MVWLNYFRKSREGSASVAKERLSIIVAREGRAKGTPNYLPQLRQELLEVLARYEKIDLDQVSVNVESQGECEVLELNVILSQPGAVRKARGLESAEFFPKAANSH